MNHNDHKQLLQKGIPGPGGVWADLGSGTGAFTLALADLIGPAGYIYSVDRDRSSLREQERTMRASFPAVRVEYILADFTQHLDLPPLDGIVMANSIPYYNSYIAIYAQADVSFS
jgi:ubiquinone/menaquinone biosynthesis C-methylase UbiE